MPEDFTYIPYEDTPEHVDNLRSFQQLRKQGFVGSDAGLNISLEEYDLLWRVLEDAVLFIHRHPGREGWYDRSTMPLSTDVRKEYSWVKFSDLCQMNDLTDQAFDALTLPEKIKLLLQEHGVENIFGTTYWGGFTVCDTTEIPDLDLEETESLFREPAVLDALATVYDERAKMEAMVKTYHSEVHRRRSQNHEAEAERYRWRAAELRRIGQLPAHGPGSQPT